MKYGFSGLLYNNRNTLDHYLYNELNYKKNSVRVMSVVLDETHPRFKELGEWNSIGVIEYAPIDTQLNSLIKYPVAKPLFFDIKFFPLINEIVNIIQSPDINIDNELDSKIIYYDRIINLWNSPHHNAYPTDTTKKIILGKTFKELNNIHPLLPFEGDKIFESRFGSSIRFGSTVLGKNNIWSDVGNNGDPITIIRNGQKISNNDPWEPIIEDINKDDSSIYLTSTQKIPLTPSSNDYTSYDNEPESIENYKGKQIILNSGRLVFNSNKNHIFFSSKKSINLNSIDSINLDTNKLSIQANKIYLGSKNAQHPALLGDITIDLLTNLIDSINRLLNVTKSLTSTPPGTPLASLNTISLQLLKSLNNIKSQLNNAKSKDIFIV